MKFEYNECLIELALNICVNNHKNQRDKGGKVYSFHPIRVSQFLDTNLEKICALLHDTVEDTTLELQAILDMFGEEVMHIVDLLSKRKEETYFEYINRLKVNPVAVRVKLADLKDNMDINRGWDIPKSMMKRMSKAKCILENEAIPFSDPDPLDDREVSL